MISSALFFGIYTPDLHAQNSPATTKSSAPAEPPTLVRNHEAESRPKVLRFGIHVSAMGKMDPHFAAGSQDRALADMVFNGLLRYQPGNAPKIEPDLAESIPNFQIVGGRQIWTVKLRKGVLFHSGPQTTSYELTADDVVYSLQKSANKDFCAYAGEYAGLTIEKVDAYTVRITLQKPASPILFLPKLADYGGGFIVSKKAIETMGYEQFKAHPVGTGPFMFERYEPGKKLILKAHKSYFRGRPRLAGIEIHFVPDDDRREAALLAGKLDVIIPCGQKGRIEALEQKDNIVVETHGVGEVTTLYLNTELAPLNDIRVRQAIAYALDRNAFLDMSNRRLTKTVYSPVPARYLPGGLPQKEVEKLGLAYAENLEKAKQLLTEAGHADGFVLELVASEKRVYRKCYELLREQLARVGIDCQISVETHSTMHKRIRNEALPIVAYIAWRPNADVFLSRFFHSNSIVITGVKPDTNFSRYSKIDKLIEAARLEIDPEKQINLWKQAQIRILNDLAAYPLIYSDQCFVRRAHVVYGHELVAAMALYPQFTEKTHLDFNRLVSSESQP
jgi:peptide/nickel transport system substrate-binding protein